MQPTNRNILLTAISLGIVVATLLVAFFVSNSTSEVQLASKATSSKQERPDQEKEIVRFPLNSASFLSALVVYADVHGFFGQEGIAAEFDSGYKIGQENISGLVTGNLDFAFTAHSTVVGDILANKPVAIIGNIAEARRHLGIIYKKDRITSPAELRGKTIAVPFGTSADYFLSLFLDFHQVPDTSVRTVNAPPARIQEKLSENSVAAAAIWNPNWHRIRNEAPETYDVFIDSGIFTTYFVLVADANRIEQTNYRNKITKVLTALQRASIDISNNPAKMSDVLTDEYGLDREFANDVAASYDFELQLPTRMKHALQQEIDWARQENPSLPAVDTRSFINTSFIDAVQQSYE